jgi:hypothetical protein
MSYQAQHVKISGKTFEHREEFKRHGGQWDGATKTWEFGTLPVDLVAKFEATVGLAVQKIGEPRTVYQPGDAQPDGSKTPGDAMPDAPAPIVRAKPIADVDGRTEFYGEGREYFGRYVGAEPRLYAEFHSLGAMVDFVERLPPGRPAIAYERGLDAREFTGTWSMADAIKLARNGWSAGVEKAQEAMAILNADHATKRGREYSVAGSRPNVGRMLASNPLHMVRRTKREGTKVTTLYVSTNASGSVDADDLIIRAACVAAIADMMENSGYSCEIIATDHTWATGADNDHPIAQAAIRLKTAGEALNLNDIVFGLGHPSMRRRFNFAIKGMSDVTYPIHKSMGQAGQAFTKSHRPEPGSYFIDKIDPGAITGDTFIERVRSAFVKIVPKDFPIHLTE